MSTSKKSKKSAKAVAKKAIVVKSKGKTTTQAAPFREGTAKAKAFATFKSEHRAYVALPHGQKKVWQQSLAKRLKLSPATVASWTGGQFAQHVK